jgi:aminoglycoside phosphotransferase (APT) family kinase protein
LLGSNVGDIRQVPSFAGNQVFRVRHADSVSYLKLAAVRDLRREVSVLGMLTSRGIGVPVVEAHDLTGERTGAPCLLLRHVGGRPLTGDEPEFGGAGRILRAVHDVTLDGFGSLVAEPVVLRGEAPTWFAAVQGRTSELGPVPEAGLVPSALIERAAAAVADAGRLLASVTTGRLLHGDFHPGHAYAADGRITGVIDWGDATAGDPVYDLARVFHSGLRSRDIEYGHSLVEAVLATYGQAPWMDADLTPKLLLYSVVLILWSMKGEFLGGAPWPPWWPAQSGALVRVLDEIEGR